MKNKISPLLKPPEKDFHLSSQGQNLKAKFLSELKNEFKNYIPNKTPRKSISKPKQKHRQKIIILLFASKGNSIGQTNGIL